jgi:hypothetical protein
MRLFRSMKEDSNGLPAVGPSGRMLGVTKIMEKGTMTHAKRLEASLYASNPGAALRAAVLELASEGCPKDVISARLEKLLLDLRGQPHRRASEEDAVLDVLDGLEGWCRPDARLLQE